MVCGDFFSEEFLAFGQKFEVQPTVWYGDSSLYRNKNFIKLYQRLHEWDDGIILPRDAQFKSRWIAQAKIFIW